MNIYGPVCSIDIETVDPELNKLGPGVFNDTGAYILGVGITEEATGYQKYYPIGHTGVSREEKVRAKEELRERLARPDPKLIVNASYDTDFLENMAGVKVNGFVHDVQIAEPLLDAYAFTYELNALAKKYNVEGKKTVDIEEWANRIDPKRATAKVKKAAQTYLWLMPWKVVADYCLQDTYAPIEILRKQLKELEAQELLPVYEMECKLLPVIMMMRRNGIRIDDEKRAQTIEVVRTIEEGILNELYGKYGTFNLNSSADIANILVAGGCELPRTEKTKKYSVTKEVLEGLTQKHPLCEPLLRSRKLNKLRTSFLEKIIPEHLCADGRIHGQFVQLKADDGGTITGRWSGRNPNLQQIPRNDEELGSLVRSVYLPNEDCWYGKTDYSQIEYRIFMHYARGWEDYDALDLMAQKARQLFNDVPETDYHQFVIDLILEKTGIVIDRATAKRINFGSLYFMGVASLARKFNIPYDQAETVYGALFDAVPFIKSTRSRVVKQAERKGYVKTLMGRRQRLSPYHLETGQTYPVFNYLIQGTAADGMKKALVDCYEAGVYNELPLHLIVHDETGVSVPKTRIGIEAYEAQQEIMNKSLTLKVPVLAEAEYGPNWGDKIKTPKGVSVFDAMRKEIGL